MTRKESVASEIRELRDKIQVLERENTGLAERAEDLLLLSMFNEAIEGDDEETSPLPAGLEKIAILKDIPFCACCSTGENVTETIAAYFSLSHDTPGSETVSLSRELITEAATVPMLFGESDFRERRIVIGLESPHLPFISGLSIPFTCQDIESGFLLFADNRQGDRLSSVSFLLNTAADMLSARLDKQILLRELKKLNAKLDHKVEMRTSELTEANRFLSREIAKREKTEHALTESEALYRSLVENMDVGVTLISREHTILMTNAAQGRMFNRSPASFHGKICFREFEKRSEVCPHCPGVIAMKIREPHEVETEGVRDDGSRFWVRIKAFPVTGSDGRCDGFIEMVEEITRQRLAIAEKERMERQLQHVQKLESLGVLAGGIAHDFNNLLTAILGNTELAQIRLPHGSPGEDNLEDIKSLSLKAADLCKQMLAYSGQASFDKKAVNLTHLVREMADILKISVSKKAALRYDFVDDLPAIEADTSQVQQVVMNLITNASEAIGDRSGAITVSSGAIDCGRAYLKSSFLDDELQEGLYVYLQVADTGEGMSEETMARIFDPFFTTKFTGRGLGMAAVLGIIRSHQGAIRLESEPGRGSTIRVLFPAVEGLPCRQVEDEEERRVEWRGSGTILLVDDEAAIRTIGRSLLEAIGFTVLTAEDGIEAIDVFREHRDSIRCVILDLTMPRMDGEQAFRKLHEIGEDIPVIISSGYSGEEINRRFTNTKPAAFVQKPYKLARLSAALRGLLQP